MNVSLLSVELLVRVDLLKDLQIFSKHRLRHVSRSAELEHALPLCVVSESRDFRQVCCIRDNHSILSVGISKKLDSHTEMCVS